MSPGALPLCTCVLPLLHTLYSCFYSGLQPTCGSYWFCMALDPSPSYPPVSSMPLPLHGCTINVLNIQRGMYNRFKASFSIQRLTALRPRPGLFGLCNVPRSTSPMYVRVTTIAHALLMLVFWPTAHVWQLLVLYGFGPFPPVSLTPLPLHGCTIKVLCILRGTYDRFKALFSIQRLTA